jgi:hypothetical protein
MIIVIIIEVRVLEMGPERPANMCYDSQENRDEVRGMIIVMIKLANMCYNSQENRDEVSE